MTFHPRVWFNFLFPPLKTWECRAVGAWLSVVDEKEREIGLAQMKQANLVQRLDNGKIVNLYCRPYGLFKGQFSPAFGSPGAGKQVAAISMLIDNMEATARIRVVNGHIFEISFDRLPSKNLRRDAEVGILSVQTGPFSANKKSHEIKASLPPDFAEMEGAVDRVDDRIRILTANQIYTATLEGELYWLLAEKVDIGMLGTLVEGDDKDIWFLSYDGRPPQRLSMLFKEAIVKARSIE